jgi:hypothetical protein
MRFVPVKSAERQAALLDHKTRDFLVRQRTQLVNTIRAHLSEFGIVVAKGIHNVDRLLEASSELPDAARPAIGLLAEQLRETQEKIDAVTARIEAAQKTDPLARRLATIPGLGAITARAIAATTPEVGNFCTARDDAAWLGLTPQPVRTGAPSSARHWFGPERRRSASLSDGSRSMPHSSGRAAARMPQHRRRIHGRDRPSARPEQSLCPAGAVHTRSKAHGGRQPSWVLMQVMPVTRTWSGRDASGHLPNRIPAHRDPMHRVPLELIAVVACPHRRLPGSR